MALRIAERRPAFCERAVSACRARFFACREFAKACFYRTGVERRVTMSFRTAFVNLSGPRTTMRSRARYRQ